MENPDILYCSCFERICTCFDGIFSDEEDEEEFKEEEIVYTGKEKEILEDMIDTLNIFEHFEEKISQIQIVEIKKGFENFYKDMISLVESETNNIRDIASDISGRISRLEIVFDLNSDLNELFCYLANYVNDTLKEIDKISEDYKIVFSVCTQSIREALILKHILVRMNSINIKNKNEEISLSVFKDLKEAKEHRCISCKPDDCHLHFNNFQISLAYDEIIDDIFKIKNDKQFLLDSIKFLENPEERKYITCKFYRNKFNK